MYILLLIGNKVDSDSVTYILPVNENIMSYSYNSTAKQCILQGTML